MTASDSSSLVRVVPWIARVAWVLVAVAGSAAIDGATSDRSDTASTVVTIAAAVGWLVGVVALAVPAVVTLTAARIVVPLAVPAGVIALAGGAEALAGGATVVAGVVAAAAVLSGELGDAYVAASAYGDERRHLLRAPVGYGTAAIVAWVLWTAVTFAGVLLLAAAAWVSGAIVSVLAVALGVLAWPRWNTLSRRWLVVVPAGVVLHDPLLLAETIMLRTSEIRDVRLAPVDTDALDLTGPAGGHVIEVSTRAMVTAALAPERRGGSPRQVHLGAYLAAPTRPGRALVSTGERLRR